MSKSEDDRDMLIIAKDYSKQAFETILMYKEEGKCIPIKAGWYGDF